MWFCSPRALLAGVLLLVGGRTLQAEVVLNEIMYHPSSEDIREEYIELLNTGTTSTNLITWRLTGGVELVFSNAVGFAAAGFQPVSAIILPPGGCLVLAANLTNFAAKYPGVTNAIGNWQGRLSNSRESVELLDGASNRIDRVAYADEGDWAIRQRSLPHFNHQGWTWLAEHDGLGKSLELVNPALPNEYGQNWAASLVTNGTPGTVNSVRQTNTAPLVLETQHLPAVPRSLDTVLITARLLDEHPTNLTATLYWRLDGGVPGFTTQPMFDDGAHDDGLAGDGVFAASIPPQTNNSVVEFYVAALDAEGVSRSWPAPAIGTNGAPLGQAANALYQVDDSSYAGTAPLYRLVMKEADRAELAAIGSASNGEQNTDAQMNGTFISVDGTGTVVRRTVGIRNRGHGSRNRKPNSFRINFSADQPWKGVTALNLNGQYTHVQVLGAVLSLKSGIPGADSRGVQVRVNNANLANNGPQTYGGVYAANEAINSDWADHWFPNDSSGNIYRAIRDIAPAEFAWRGTNWTAYTNTWFKHSNTSENDWSDLLDMLRIMGTNDLYSTASATNVIHTEEWLRWAAVMALFDTRETCPNTGDNDDYFLYAGSVDRRFRLVYYDLDTILGEGSPAGATNDTIFGIATAGRPFNLSQFVRSPDYLPEYYRSLQHLLDTSFSKTEFDLTVDQTLSGSVPANVLAQIKRWMDGRRAYVQSLTTAFLSTNGLPPVATIAGEPRSPTSLSSATLVVGGAGVTHYRYRLNDGTFGSVTPVATPIQLNSLPGGSTNTIFVIGLGTNGLWQAEAAATVSRTWTVNTSWPAVRLNEVLARNDGVLNHSNTFPDAIELYNEGTAVVDLSGLRLTDRITSPGKYTFPTGTLLAPGNYLVVYANNNDGTGGLHTGFSLDQDGEGVFLFDKTANGGALLDSVQFGLQLSNLAIGRVGGAGEFVLTQPTFGTNNVVQPLAEQRGLKINEWLAAELAAATTDFIELHNPGSLPAAIGGLYFTDNPIGEPAKSPVAPLSFISAKGYRVFKADGDPQQGLDHLNFKLGAEQGLIALLTGQAETIDLIQYGPQRTDVSEGRSPDGGNAITGFSTPTPGAANGGAPTPCTLLSTTTSLLAWTNVWKYNQVTNLDGVNWTAPAYDDSVWPAGPGLLAYETDTWIASLLGTTLANPQNPPAGLSTGHAYYFRTTVVVTNDLAGYTLNARMRLDDCGVIYINGNEFSRPRMPSGTITNRSFGSGAIGANTDATIDETFTIPASQLHPGTNTIAVEVHQINSSSSDIVWGLALDATITRTNCNPASLVLNEVFADNESFTNLLGNATDWIELYNAGTNIVVLGDMSLTDEVSNPRKWVFPSGTSLAPGARLTVECDDLQPPSAGNTGFGLNSAGDAVYLFDSLAQGGKMLDSITFGLQAPDFSIGRAPDGAGSWGLTLPTRDTPNVPATLGNASAVRINEWLAANPDGDDWLELYNPNAQPVDLSGLALTDNPSSRAKSPFPLLSFLGPARYRKMIADGQTGAAADHVNFRLNAAGGFLGFYWPIGTQIDALSYGPQSASVAQGRFPDGAGSFATFPDTASPGAANYRLLSGVVISEVLSHTDPPLEDAVEIQNLGSTALDIGGWLLSNSDQRLRKFVIPSNTWIIAGGFKVFYEYEFGGNASPAAIAPFNFNSAHGDEVHLAQTDGAGSPTGWRARARFGAAANGISFGRFLTSIGEEFVALSHPSLGVENPIDLADFRAGTGATNSYPMVGPVVLSEIHYAPTNRYDTNRSNSGEFIELRNVAGSVVPLYDPEASTNTWKISGGIDFTFPSGSSLPAGGVLVLVGFDPVAEPAELDWFRNAYHLAATIPVYGPYSGALANEGDTIQILKPDPPQVAPHPDAGFVPYVLVERVQYQPTAPWPAVAAGSGVALQRRVSTEFANEPLNWFAALPTAGLLTDTDTDGDGLPDYWELAHGLDPASSSGNDGGSGDVDADGQNNRAEFLAGTDPQDPGDYLHIESLSLDSGQVTIRFFAAASRSYSVLYTDSPSSGPWYKLTDVPPSANPHNAGVVDPGYDGSRSRFYRLVTPATSAP